MIQIVSLLISICVDIVGWYYIFGEKELLVRRGMYSLCDCFEITNKKDENASLH